MFFDENGIFRLDEMVAQRATFKKIMEDGIVTDEEVKAQAELVLSLYRNLDNIFDAEQLAVIADVITETGVLHSITQYIELKEFYR